MKSVHFMEQGFSRTYWDFFAGFGLFVTVFQCVAAIFAWQLGGLSEQSFNSMRASAWALALCFGVVAVLSWPTSSFHHWYFLCGLSRACLRGTLMSQRA